jgi:hypothetical protein
MKLLLASLLAGSAAAFAPSTPNGASLTKASMATETVEDLKVLAKKLNPILGYFDPLGLSERKFWDTSSSATIGFLRESEIKVRIAGGDICLTSCPESYNFHPVM